MPTNQQHTANWPESKKKRLEIKIKQIQQSSQSIDIMPLIKIDIIPVPKPRMTRSDAWKKRDCVQKYWEFKDRLRELYGDRELPETIRLIFIIPMPSSWSEKKKALYDGTPQQTKPDIDNLTKSVFDCLAAQDSYIWRVDAAKYWGREGSISIRNLGEST
jgi:Holliday junction resolvase RusA-like endonuclease